MINQDIIIQLLSDKNVFNDVIKEFPSIYSSCVMIKQNITEETVNKGITKLIEFYNKNAKFKALIETHAAKCSVTESDNNLKNNMAGMIIVIDKQESSYKKLMDTAKKEKWQYRGIAILPEFTQLRLYFY